MAYTIEDLLGQVPLLTCLLDGPAEIPQLPFSTSTLLDKSSPSNSGVLTVRARDHAGAAMIMRSTPCCGTLAGPSGPALNWRAFGPKTEMIRRLSRSETSRRAWEIRKAWKRTYEEIWKVYLVYASHIQLPSKTCFLGGCVMSLALVGISRCWF